MNPNYLDFEQPIAELEAKIEGLCRVADGSLRLVNDPDSREARSWLYRLVLP